MPKYWFDHVHLISPDPIKTAQLYESMFGAKITSIRRPPETDGIPRVQLDFGGIGIFIMGQKTKPDFALAHFGVRTDNIEAAVAELKAKGVEVKGEITVAQTGNKVVNLVGPENLPIELRELG